MCRVPWPSVLLFSSCHTIVLLPSSPPPISGWSLPAQHDMRTHTPVWVTQHILCNGMYLYAGSFASMRTAGCGGGRTVLILKQAICEWMPLAQGEWRQEGLGKMLWSWPMYQNQDWLSIAGEKSNSSDTVMWYNNNIFPSYCCTLSCWIQYAQKVVEEPGNKGAILLFSSYASLVPSPPSNMQPKSCLGMTITLSVYIMQLKSWPKGWEWYSV